MAEDDVSSISMRIKSRREYLELTQEEVANSTGISRSSISKIESGLRKVSSEELKRISALLRISIDSLLGTDETPSNTREIQLLARKFSGLTKDDQKELLRFAEFLSSKREKE